VKQAVSEAAVIQRIQARVPSQRWTPEYTYIGSLLRLSIEALYYRRYIEQIQARVPSQRWTPEYTYIVRTHR
jgi:hypothetical protein